MSFQCIADLTAHWQQNRGAEDLQLEVEICPANMKGDITLNCFRLAKPLKANPMALAQEACEFFQAHADTVAVEVAKAFVNVTLSEVALFRDTVADQDALLANAQVQSSDKRKYVIEYSAPNTNKPLHLGHVRNNSLGMALVAILKRAGHDVTPVNLVNDRGVHICKSMIAYQRFGEGCTPESTGQKGDHLVGSFYVKYASALKEQIQELKAQNPELADKPEEKLFLQTEIGRAAQDMLIAWEDEDTDVRDLWKTMNSWVMAGFDQTYERMGIAFDEVYLESETYKLGKDIIEDGLAKDIFYKRDDGATEIDLKKYKLDKKVVLRSDGTSVYITQDLGTTLRKHDEHQPDTMIWVVGDEQIYHFRVLFAILKELGYEWADSLHHLAYGMVNLPTGRMKSREGTAVDADNLFDELHQLAKNEILSRVGDDVPDDIDDRAEIIGMGAVKFMLLKVNPKTTMKFDPESAVKFEGDTAAYIQYACARIASICRKAEEKEVADAADWALLTHEKERALAICCSEYGAIIQKAAGDLDPGCLANYLIELAKAFSSFFHDCPVVKGDTDPVLRRTRLELTKVVRTILVDGLAALTIKPLERM